MNRFARFSAPTVVAGLLLAALPSAAPAATVWMFDGPPGPMSSVMYTAGPGEANRLTVTETDTSIVFDDPGELITPALPCVQDGPSRASCPLPLADGNVTVLLGDADDTATLLLRRGGHFSGADVDGWDGNDVLTAGDIATVIRGNAGDDTLVGGTADDIVLGGTGNDTLNPGTGRDQVRGEEGDDTIDARDAYYDLVRCGDGIDTYRPDYVDFISMLPDHGCENVERPPDAPVQGGNDAGTGNGGGIPTHTPPIFRVGQRTVKARGKTAKVAMRCNAGPGSACVGRIRLVHGSKVIGQSPRFSVHAGKTRVAAIKLGTAGRKLSRRRGGTKVKLVAVGTNGDVTPLGSVKLVTR
jgi:Ca2+-binding RTX toxin-like protein